MSYQFKLLPKYRVSRPGPVMTQEELMLPYLGFAHFNRPTDRRTGVATAAHTSSCAVPHDVRGRTELAGGRRRARPGYFNVAVCLAGLNGEIGIRCCGWCRMGSASVGFFFP